MTNQNTGNPSIFIRHAELLLVVTFAVIAAVTAQYGGQFEPVFETRDAFDEIAEKLLRVNGDNCAIMHVGDLKLPEDTVSHLPDIKEININPVFPNRTDLLHLHNMALSRAFFFSYMLQSRFNRPAINDTYDPGMMYYFLSTVADVSANPRYANKTFSCDSFQNFAQFSESTPRPSTSVPTCPTLPLTGASSI